MARITSISGRQCPTGCGDEDVLARAPGIFGLVIGMSTRRATCSSGRSILDVLHLEDEASKREERETRSRKVVETLRDTSRVVSAGTRMADKYQFKRSLEQLSKRSPCQGKRRRTTKDDFKHHEEMRDDLAPAETQPLAGTAKD